jgi:hypothetical protein
MKRNGIESSDVLYWKKDKKEWSLCNNHEFSLFVQHFLLVNKTAKKKTNKGKNKVFTR